MKTTKEQLPLLFSWKVIDIQDPKKRVDILFHPEGLFTIRTESGTLNLSNAKVLAQLMLNHSIKKFGSYDSIVKELNGIKENIRKAYGN